MTTAVLDAPVVLVHGYGSTRRCWVFVERSLRAAGFGTVVSMSHHPLGGDIPALAGRLVRLTHSVIADTGAARVHLVGHSVGGLIIRYAVCLLGLDPFVDTAITVATPHSGCQFAWFGLDAALMQCRPASEVLRTLHAAVRPGETHWVAYYSDHDLVVPVSSAMIAAADLQAENVLLRNESHVSILFCPRLARGISTRLSAATASRRFLAGR